MSIFNVQMTDAANGERLADYCTDKHQVRWVTDWKCWVIYDGTRWKIQPDDTALEAIAKEMAAEVIIKGADSVSPPGTKAYDDLVKWGVTTLKRSGWMAAVSAMKSVARVRVESEIFDGDPFALNCLNGTVDLRTGVRRDHNPDDMITRLVPHEYNPTAKAPEWRALLERATQVDPSGETADYLEMILGYMQVGGNPEDMIPFIIGPKGCGKSKVVEIPVDVLGHDYAWVSMPELITRGQLHTEKFLKITEKRYIAISETSEVMVLDEARVKNVTGATWVSNRALYGADQNNKLEATILVATNEPPLIPNFDDAIVRRLMIIPSGPSLEPHEKDTSLHDRIVKTEAEGVLASIVRGAASWWQKAQMVNPETGEPVGDRRRAVFGLDGIGMPTKVAEATLSFIYEHDPILQFIEARIDFAEGVSMQATELHEAYERFFGWKRGRRYFYDHFVKAAHTRGATFVSKDTRKFYGVRLADSYLPFEGSHLNDISRKTDN